jgi:hypothetical protein
VNERGDQVFAGSTLSMNEDGALCGGDLLYILQQAERRGIGGSVGGEGGVGELSRGGLGCGR